MTWTAASGLPAWRTARYTIVRLPAEIDVSNADVVEERLLALADEDRPPCAPLIVDLTGTTFFDASAVNALLRLRVRLVPLGRRVYAVVPPGGIIRRVLEVAAISHLVPLCEDIGSAVAMAVVDTLDAAGRPGSESTP